MALNDVKRLLRIDTADTSHDDDLTLCIDIATQKVLNYLGVDTLPSKAEYIVDEVAKARFQLITRDEENETGAQSYNDSLGSITYGNDGDLLLPFYTELNTIKESLSRRVRFR